MTVLTIPSDRFQRDYLVHSEQFPLHSLHSPGMKAKKQCRNGNFGLFQLKHTPKDWDITIAYF